MQREQGERVRAHILLCELFLREVTRDPERDGELVRERLQLFCVTASCDHEPQALLSSCCDSANKCVHSLLRHESANSENDDILRTEACTRA